MLRFVHISDIHLRKGWAEEQGLVLSAFFNDLQRQLADPAQSYAIITGDLLQEGGNAELYPLFTDQIQSRFESVGLSRDRTIVVPGNHDVDRDYTKSQLAVLKALGDQTTTETEFNSQIYGELTGLVYPKFARYIDWQASAPGPHLTAATFCGAGFEVSPKTGLYCLNSALYSFGGLRDTHGNVIDDMHRLPIETRALHDWVQNTKYQFRILAMHHPMSWLTSWARDELLSLARNNFDLVLSGHTHVTEKGEYSDGTRSFIECVAPALFTRKSEQLGYCIVELDEENLEICLRYRQWVRDRFVTGTALSGTDDGAVIFNAKSRSLVGASAGSDKLHAAVRVQLENAFNQSLKSYASLPPLWALPNVADKAENTDERTEAVIQSVDKLTAPLRDCIIKAPTQFGLTAVGRYLALTAWNQNPGQFVLFVEAGMLPNHESGIKAAISAALAEKGLTRDHLVGIVLDNAEVAHERLINNLHKEYPGIALILLFTVKDQTQIQRPLSSAIKFPITTYYLWSLDRVQIRELVRQFIAFTGSLDEENAVKSLTRDLENLNLHRTPIACLTLLLIYEKQVDFSPANRTEMLSRFLYLLFAIYKKTPNYSNIPDMKDSEVVLGHFCERLLRDGQTEFKKAEFISSAMNYCAEVKIDVDCAQLFAVLEAERIIVPRAGAYHFRYVHWIYFFAAHRMHHNAAFRDYILSNTRYVAYPEIIEFYSGLDRRRSELIDILTNDLRTINAAFEARTQIRGDFDPYALARWDPTPDQVTDLRQSLKDQVNATTLPAEVKDKIADATYDRGKPYVQEIRHFIDQSSLNKCLLMMRSAARALRNSDYVDAGRKKLLLEEVIRTWTKLMQMLVIVSPALAKDGYVMFEDLTYILSPSFEQWEGWDLWMKLFELLPYNILNFYEQDIASERLAPLFKDYLQESKSEAGKFIIGAILTRQRPREWFAAVRSYMLGLPKNSFYLFSMLTELGNELAFAYVTREHKDEIEQLAAVAVAKHELGAANPSQGLLRRVGKRIHENAAKEAANEAGPQSEKEKSAGGDASS